jgi:hypothetical protein
VPRKARKERNYSQRLPCARDQQFHAAHNVLFHLHELGELLRKIRAELAGSLATESMAYFHTHQQNELINRIQRHHKLYNSTSNACWSSGRRSSLIGRSARTCDRASYDDSTTHELLLRAATLQHIAILTIHSAVKGKVMMYGGPRHRRYRECTDRDHPFQTAVQTSCSMVVEADFEAARPIHYQFLPRLSISRCAGMRPERVGKGGAYSRSPRLSHRVRAMHLCYFFLSSLLVNIFFVLESREIQAQVSSGNNRVVGRVGGCCCLL